MPAMLLGRIALVALTYAPYRIVQQVIFGTQKARRNALKTCRSGVDYVDHRARSPEVSKRSDRSSFEAATALLAGRVSIRTIPEAQRRTAAEALLDELGGTIERISRVARPARRRPIDTPLCLPPEHWPPRFAQGRFLSAAARSYPPTEVCLGRFRVWAGACRSSIDRIDLLCVTGECRAMPESTSIEDWEAKAARAREAAKQMVSPTATRIMLEIGMFYMFWPAKRGTMLRLRSRADCPVLPLPQHDPQHDPPQGPLKRCATAASHASRRIFGIKILHSQP